MARAPLIEAVEALDYTVGCVTRARLATAPAGDRGSDLRIGFPDPAPLNGSGLLRGATLSVDLSLSAIGSERSTVLRYAYSLNNYAGRELLAFHWHPDGRSPVAFPRLHVSAALRGTTPSGEPAVLPLDKAHIPTGYLSAADVVRLLVAELGIGTLAGDWRERVGRATPMLPSFPA